MKSIIANKFIILIIIVTVAMSAFLLLYNKNSSPKETVELYFTYFNNKDGARMQSLVTGPPRDTANLKYLEYVRLLSCYEEQNNEKIDYKNLKEIWYPQAKYVAKFYVTFDIKYADDALTTGGFENGVYMWEFYLAKKAENGPWIIVSYGN